MIREYGVDVQVDARAFAIFFYVLSQDIDGFASMPWTKRARYLKETWHVEVSEFTLRKWCVIFIDNETAIKDKTTKTYWKTYYSYGQKQQEMLVEGKENLEWKRYWERFMKLKNQGEQDIGKKVFRELGYCVYACASYLFSAWSEDMMKELTEAVAASV